MVRARPLVDIDQSQEQDTGIVVDGHRLMVMTRHAADRWAAELAELGELTGVRVTPEHIRQDVRANGHPLPGKFIHSVYLADDGGRPCALLGGNEEPAGVFGFAALHVVLLAIQPDLRGRGLSRSFAEAAIRRTVSLGWTELETEEPFALACGIRDGAPRDILEPYYRRLGFQPVGLRHVSDVDGEVFVMRAGVDDLLRAPTAN